MSHARFFHSVGAVRTHVPEYRCTLCARFPGGDFSLNPLRRLYEAHKLSHGCGSEVTHLVTN
jgi:hypothetical protein